MPNLDLQRSWQTNRQTAAVCPDACRRMLASRVCSGCQLSVVVLGAARNQQCMTHMTRVKQGTGIMYTAMLQASQTLCPHLDLQQGAVRLSSHICQLSL